MVKFTK